MTGNIRLFEKTEKGLPVEVDPSEADAAKAAWRYSSANFVAHVLYTAEEEAARDAEEAAEATKERCRSRNLWSISSPT
jgi:hypothetical protein